MKVLVINAGSSSLKYQLIDMDGEKVLCKGLCESIESTAVSLSWWCVWDSYADSDDEYFKWWTSRG